MKKCFIVVALVLLCTNCAWHNHPSETAYNRMVSSWIGRGIADLYADWGYPNNSQSLTNNTYLETYYKMDKNSYFPRRHYKDFTDDWRVKIGNKFDVKPMPAEYNCRTSFIITNGVIMDYSYEGVGCVE